MSIVLKRVLFCCFLILPIFAGADIQYEPLSSSERHELFVGSTVLPEKYRFQIFRVFSFKHNVLLKEVDLILSESYRDIFVPGIQWGGSFFLYNDPSKNSSIKNYGVCATGRTLSGHLGLSLSLFRKFFLKPFGSAGLSGSLCFLKDVSKMLSQKAVFSPYLSYGLFLSFKVFDRGAVYSLDQDYGLNDIGFKGECMHNFYPEKSSSHETKNRFCLIGLQLSF